MHNSKCEIVGKLVFKNFYFGNERRWQWKKSLISKAMGFYGNLNGSMVITGESGSGKSNACKVIIDQLFKSGCTVSILDPHGEYLGIADGIHAEVYDAARSGINIFDLDGVGEKERSSELASMFRRIFRLGEVQSYVLYRCLLYTYRNCAENGSSPTIKTLLYTISRFKLHASGQEAHILEALEKRLSLIDSGPFSRSISFGKLLSENSIILLSGLHTIEAQKVYMEGFLRKVYNSMQSLNGRKLRIFIDEAGKIADSPLPGRLAAEGRKYGIGLISVSQRAKSLDKDVNSNAALLISFYQREPEELNYLASYIAGGTEMGRYAEVKKAIRGLRRGYAIVMDYSEPEPVIVRFSEAKEGKGSLSFSMLSLSTEGISEGELLNKLSSDGFEKDTISGCVKKLEDEGRLMHFDVAAKRFCGRWYISSPRNSPEHDISVHIMHLRLKELGVRSRVYNSAYGPDIIAYLDGIKYALEYETGTKDAKQLTEMLSKRSKHYGRIIVVANEKAFAKYASIGYCLRTFCDYISDPLKDSKCETKDIIMQHAE